MVALMVADGSGRGRCSFLALLLTGVWSWQPVHPVYEIGGIASTDAREVFGVQNAIHVQPAQVR